MYLKVNFGWDGQESRLRQWQVILCCQVKQEPVLQRTEIIRGSSLGNSIKDVTRFMHLKSARKARVGSRALCRVGGTGSFWLKWLTVNAKCKGITVGVMWCGPALSCWWEREGGQWRGHHQVLSRHRGWCQKLMVVGEKDTLAKEEFKPAHADDSTKYRSVIVSWQRASGAG